MHEHEQEEEEEEEEFNYMHAYIYDILVFNTKLRMSVHVMVLSGKEAG